MDYEEKYKEALEWARKVMQGKVGFVLDEVLEKFPELKESEDERVRKTLKEYFINSFQNNGVAAICGMHIKDILAWLEKQGKNNMSISEATKQELEDNLNKALEKETPESCNEFLEKQGEQKTADKVEPKFKVGDTIKYNGTEYKITEITPNGYKVYALTYDEDAASLISFSAPAILVEQKPAWSQEDERTYRSIAYSFAHNFPLTIQQQEFVKSLKDRVQPKVELTQLDKNILEAAIAFVELNNHFNCWRGVNKHTVVSALHSLEPQNTWKPSDEQINALEYYIYSTSPTATITKGTIYGNLMVELLEQLKKLKGE